MRVTQDKWVKVVNGRNIRMTYVSALPNPSLAVRPCAGQDMVQSCHRCSFDLTVDKVVRYSSTD